ncbi:hypothetical protein B5807_01509 [Epicoccum nigrum]|uniref:Uncharacterized protein n=1 Tax=Epicoccum nigrum TaxID=105696 RepID=A0A1Y2MHA2_EPING|nr:hypothetical protein B5807_01509 [Epicoccum nigrum]
MLFTSHLVILILPLTALAVHQGSYGNVTTQSDGEIMEEETYVTQDGTEDIRPSTIGWRNATRSVAPCRNGTESNTTEYETHLAYCFDNNRAVNLSSGRTEVVANWSFTNSEAGRVGGYYQPTATGWEEATAIRNRETSINVQYGTLFELRQTQDPYKPDDPMLDLAEPLAFHQTAMGIEGRI